jgi:hypothetical protein
MAVRRVSRYSALSGHWTSLGFNLLLALSEIAVIYGIEAVAWFEYTLSTPFESTAVTT